ncbi:acylphosphatase [Sphingobacterium sp. E70]|uniref:acylphosphatase n=1 Tax=Sphingobacterium sp. E70 TaxID=2853439 RepID=UPI00211C4904|nr:acylphosphatase [Sphingobacterium sp. E70]ULT27904.1 acylphosphatase [Sphingobacterium sp. E70]
MKHLNISIRGKVQESFRLTAKAVADQVGVKGFVVNQKDGSVYIEAEGDDFALDSMMDFCQEGPEDATVEAVEVEEGELKGFSNFEVIKRVQSQA